MDLQAALPHRAPFLLLDEVVSADANTLVARACPRADDPLFAQVYAGHYPGSPITPGVLLCEMVFQAGAALLAHRLGPAGTADGVPVLVRIQDARFKKPVQPGDALEISATFVEQVSTAFYLKGTVKAGGQLAVRVSFTCALAPKSVLQDDGGTP